MQFWNPFAFRPGQVSFWTTVIYLAVGIALIYVHETVPHAPADQKLAKSDLNLTEAWRDLLKISSAFHPYNSHENDNVREFIITRSKEILDRNGIKYSTDKSGGTVWHSRANDVENLEAHESSDLDSRPPGVTLFDDEISNVTWTESHGGMIGANIGKTTGIGWYFEGNNYYVYIHGKDDPPGDWWLSKSRFKKFQGSGGVLVNCHFDSVSTGYGATDDGMACVSMLQLLSHFTSKDRQPRNGIVLLFNNAEEDGLWGAHAFGYSPLLQFCHTFVNLEGAGAGGRAMLFRTTDLLAAQAYGGSPHPFGSVLAGDAFAKGLVKSGTDYQIFADNFGQRGIDVAFYDPRARYHTDEDDARHTTKTSIWHMLSAALASTQKLSRTTGTKFNGPRSDGNKDLVLNGKQTKGVWFDLFGKVWATFALRGLFAWSLTLLVATPLILVAITFVLVHNDKYYFFARDIKMAESINEDPVAIGGWKGFVRFPFAVIFAGLITIGSVFLLIKFNPLIIYSSAYAVWAMALSSFYFSFWLIMRGSSFVRPSALHRGFALMWLFALGWVTQVLAAVVEDRNQIGALYSTVFFQSAVFLSLLISLLEQFSLLGKNNFARQFHGVNLATDGPASDGNDASASIEDEAEVNGGDQGNDQGDPDDDNDDSEDSETNEPDEPTERTPLRAGEQGYGSNTRPSFATTYRRSVSEPEPAASSMQRYEPFNGEQLWSGRLVSWTWFIQFLLLAPVPLVMIGNLGLLAMSSLHMTATDGGSVLTPLLAIGVLSIVLLLPITPFIHRVTHHVPVFLLCIFIGTLAYNLIAFPFSANNRFKFYFQQVLDLDNGTDIVTLTGIKRYTLDIIDSIPTATTQKIHCEKSVRPFLVDCSYDSSALPPRLVKGKTPEELMTVTTLDGTDESTARFQIQALDTRICGIESSRPIYGFSVDGGVSRDTRFGSFPQDGLRNILITRRDRDLPWNLTMALRENSPFVEDDFKGSDPKHPSTENYFGRPQLHEGTTLSRRSESFEVTISCAWSDANDVNAIPTLHELKQYMPSWAVVTKKDAALVKVRKTFKIQG
ncbi:hypothetical protein G7046_g518 [Stylonectria norvegica]|nr:hypothetical protein G7046_g518 [Stylonectria norvegica]